MAAKLSNDIDTLLEEYLQLLDQYTKLRSQLNVAQSEVHLHLARANFEADRGKRYGPELYDARMQASRLCRITSDHDPAQSPSHGTTASTASFTLSTFAPHEEVTKRQRTSDGTLQADREDELSVGVEGLDLEEMEKEDSEKETQNDEAEEGTGNPEKGTGSDGEKNSNPSRGKPPPNPLRMFGILHPPSLRTAQVTSVTVASNLIPALTTLSLQMAELEIRIRRARKHMLIAEKKEKTSTVGSGITA